MNTIDRIVNAIQMTCNRMGWELELISKPSDTFAEYKATLPSGVGGISAEFRIYVDPLTPGRELGMTGDNLINSFEPKADIFEKALREAVRQALEALPVESFAEMDALIEQYLKGPIRGWVDITRENGIKRELAQEEASEPTPAKDTEGGGGVGRKPLTDDEWKERHKQVEAVLEKAKGLHISEEKACGRLGIPYGTFKDWKRHWRKKG